MSDGGQTSVRDVRIGVAVTVLLLLAVLGFEVVSREAARNDFNSMYIAAWIMRHGDAAHLYDFQEQMNAEKEVFHISGLLPVIHPPFEALFVMPFAWMSYFQAYFLWGLIDILLWLWFCWAIRPFAPVPTPTFQYLILCFAYLPVWVAFLQGQTSIVLLVLYSLVYLSVKAGRDYRAGLFLGLGLFRFQLVVPFALIYLVRRKWATLAGLATMAMILGVISIVAVGVDGVRSYVQLLFGIATNPAHPYNGIVPAFHMMSVNSFFQVVLSGRIAPSWITLLSALTAISLIAFVAWVWRRQDLGSGGRPELLFAAALAVSIVTGFHSLYHDLSLMLLAVLLVLGCPDFRFGQGWWRTALSASSLLLFGVPIVAIGLKGLHMYVMCPILITFAIAAVHLSGNSSADKQTIA